MAIFNYCTGPNGLRSFLAYPRHPDKRRPVQRRRRTPRTSTFFTGSRRFSEPPVFRPLQSTQSHHRHAPYSSKYLVEWIRSCNRTLRSAISHLSQMQHQGGIFKHKQQRLRHHKQLFPPHWNLSKHLTSAKHYLPLSRPLYGLNPKSHPN